ncbi:MAG: hypothetical protein Q9160_007410 [Pyrenula sp. 1 TL-2023]
MPLPIRRPRHRRPNGERKSRVRIDIITRAPKPLDPAKPSVAQLPEDIVQQILGYLQQLWPQDVLTVASLSSYLYKPARYVQHRDVHIDLKWSKHIHERLDLIICRGLLPAVRTFEVSGSCEYWKEPESEARDVLNRLADMLPGMGGLRVFGWQVQTPIPMPILESLRHGVDLCTTVSCDSADGSHAQAREFLDRLANNTRLRTLSVQIEFVNDQECLKTMQVLKKILLSCPNLTRIPLLDVHYPRGVCRSFRPSRNGALVCGVGLSGGERPLALEELGIRDYPCGIGGALYCRGERRYSERGHEWKYWVEGFDWSRLARLNNVPPIDPAIVAPKMTGLRQLIIDDYRGGEANFLDEITSPLNVLSILGWSRLSNRSDTITKHGPTLQKLKIHQPEGHWSRNADDTVTVLDLVQLSDGLPHLEELALDITRHGSSTLWPYAALDAISRFPSLRAVELWFPLGTKPPAPTPLLIVSSARHIFSYLHERNRNIWRLILHSGTPYNPYSFDNRDTWSDHMSITYVCNMAYDGDAGEGRISVTCPDLSPEMNERLDRLVQKSDLDPLDPRTLDKAGLLLKSALEGPLTWDDWKAWQQERRKPDFREQNGVLQKFMIGPFKRASGF